MKSFSTQKNFALHLITVLVATLVLGLVVYHACLDTLKETLRINLLSSVTQGAYSLDSFLNTQISLLRILASSEETRNYQRDKTPLWRDPHQSIRTLKRINYIDPDGGGIASDGTKFWIGDRPYFRSALAGKEVIDGPILSRIDNKWVAVVAVPVFGDDGRVKGVLSASLDADNFKAALAAIRGTGFGDSWVLNTNATVVAHTDGQNYPTGVSFLRAWFADKHNYWIEPAETQNVAEIGGMVVARQKLGTVGWVLWRAVSADDFLTPFRTILLALGGLMVLGLLGITVFFIFRHRGEIRVLEMKEERERAIKEAYGHIRNLAYYDAVTRLPNRHLILRRLGEKMRDHENAELFLISLARFRSLNTTFGLSFGDTLLKEVTQRLQQLWKSEPDVFVGRLGGNEFLMLKNLSLVDTDYKASQKLERSCAQIVQAFVPPMGQGDLRVNVSIHVGACIIQSAGSTPEEVLKAAETALFEARRRELSGFAVFSQEGARLVHRRARLEHLLPDALDRGEIEVYYQPQVDLFDNAVVGYEALVRWNSPLFGPVSPVEFIPLAEETGFIQKLGLWVLRQSIEFSKLINARSSRAVVVSVNVSPIQLLHPNFFDSVTSILLESGLPPVLLGLEITESSLMEAFDSVNPSIQILMERGIKFSLDDFGTGYSSLNYLKNLPLNVVKLDKSFIDGLATDVRMGKMVRSIIELAHHLGLKVIAEGIETEDQRVFIKECGCDYIQGYLVSKPLPPEKITFGLAVG